MAARQKLKLLYLQSIFLKLTDASHGLTATELMAELESFGVHIERKTLYADIELLRESGMDIVKGPGKAPTYRLASREFDGQELMLMADAVQSSRFLTEEYAAELVGKISSLGSDREALDMPRHLHVDGRIKMQNDSVFYNLDTVRRAIGAGRRVSFLYYKYDATKARVLQRDGARYVETPVHVVYSDGCYYLIAYNEKYDNLVTYRIDRMLDVAVASELAAESEAVRSFDPKEYEYRVFGMHSGDVRALKLRVDSGAIGGIIDRFGKDVAMRALPDGSAEVGVSVIVSTRFYGWLAQFGKRVVIVAPESVRRDYTEYLAGIISEYENPRRG